MAVPLVIEPVLPAFRRVCPDVSVEIAVEGTVVDLAARGFDAGTRIGEFSQRDMIAVRLTPDIRWTVAGAPAYFAERGRPTAPEELTRHECIRYRLPTSGAIYRRDFVRGGRGVSVDPPGGVVVNDGTLAIALAGVVPALSTPPIWSSGRSWPPDGWSACSNRSCRQRRGSSSTFPPAPRHSPSWALS